MEHQQHASLRMYALILVSTFNALLSGDLQRDGSSCTPSNAAFGVGLPVQIAVSKRHLDKVWLHDFTARTIAEWVSFSQRTMFA